MSNSRTKRRRPSSRAYRPAIDGKLEDRVLLSSQRIRLEQYLATNRGLLNHTAAGFAFYVNRPPFTQNAPPFNRQYRKIQAAAVQTARGGQAADVVAVDGSHFRIQLGYESNTVATTAGDGAAGTYTASTPQTALSTSQPTETPQPIGTVRVYAMPNGEVGIIVDGSNDNTELTINPLPTPIRRGYAHSYAYGQANVSHILNIGQITVNSGSIAAIEGFHTANLVGPLVVNGQTTVDRIAFNSIGPGASITVGGTLNTLDVLQGIQLGQAASGTTPAKPGTISIAGDLNLLNVGQNITLSNGSQFTIGRDLGLVNQPPKGTGTGSDVLTVNFVAISNTITTVTTPPPVSSFIQGSVVINSGSQFSIGRNIDNIMYIEGSITGFSHLLVNTTTTPASPTFVTKIPEEILSPSNTVVALGGGTP